MASPVVVVSCVDRPGIVSEVTTALAHTGANIIHAEQALDPSGIFFQRLHCELDAPEWYNKVVQALTPLKKDPTFSFSVKDLQARPKTAILVSKELHCLFDLLSRRFTNDITIDPAVIISDHKEAASVAEMFGIPFIYAPMTQQRTDQENFILRELKKAGVDLIILARYMRILSGGFVSEFPQQIINIHHSFLPSFVGKNPHSDALSRGVKLIGATSHYVIEELDAGPIIEQDVIRVSHLDAIEDLRRKGGDMEKIVLARAVQAHVEHRVVVCENRTLVFN